jgi:hypothetical protein
MTDVLSVARQTVGNAAPLSAATAAYVAAHASTTDTFPVDDPRGPLDEAHVHVLTDNLHEPGDENITMRSGPADMSPQDEAAAILKVVLASTGPVLLCMPGTDGPAWESSMYETARAAVRMYHGQMVAVSIPYHNAVKDVIRRFFHIGTSSKDSVLALVISGIHAAQPNRPILLAGESQGSWVIGHDLQDPQLAADVTRVAVFAKPGFQQAPAAVGAAAAGAHLLPGRPGYIEFRHTDDIVPSLFAHLGLDVLGGYVMAIRRWFQTGNFEYTPHHYDMHGPEAANYLLNGVMPASLVHSSTDDL